jgi:hypothetical protein
VAVIINRRGFIQGLASLVAAPAVIRVTTIMPVKVMPPEELLVEVQRVGGINLAAIRELLLPGLRALEAKHYSTPSQYALLFGEK